MSEIETTAPKVDVESSTAQPLPEHSTGAKVQPWLNVDASSASVKQVAPVQAEKVAPAVAFEPEAATPPAVAEKPKEPTTAEGRAQLDEWRQKSSVYFEHKQAHPNVDINELSSGFKSSKQGTFGADLAAKILKSMGTKR